MKDVPNCSFASNPCRIQYTNQEIVIMRNDLVEKMCRNSIHMPSTTADIPEHVKIFFSNMKISLLFAFFSFNFKDFMIHLDAIVSFWILLIFFCIRLNSTLDTVTSTSVCIS